ncbi:MAG: hydrogenase maturation nickel metallochaperone HypA [Epsilonproteobacteria bacterium]|nr:hydrogenase maturation nickel metallochaperone HypA [Campylobacterota bacterium]NPA64317.1 hydrogenase maturation nickel metallochaperone HypA [Campylobacterota bacterium]
MHEYSIVQSLLDIIEESARRHGAKRVNRVVVKIGVLSGVEPHLLKVAFDTFKEASICRDAAMEMVIQPIVARCKECGEVSEFERGEIFFECRKCGGVELDIIDGEDMILQSLEME